MIKHVFNVFLTVNISWHCVKSTGNSCGRNESAHMF